MSGRMMRVVLASGFLLAAGALSAELASAAAPEIKPGDTVIVPRDGVKLMLGDKIVVELPKGTQFSVGTVKGEWLGGSATLAGRKEKGWVQRRDIEASSSADGRSQAAKPASPPAATAVVGEGGARLMLGDRIVAQLPKGTKVDVTAVKDAWVGARVLFEGKSVRGWIAKEQISWESVASPAAELSDGVVRVKAGTQGCELLLVRSYSPQQLQGLGYGYMAPRMFGIGTAPFEPSLTDSRFVALRVRVPVRDEQVHVPSLRLTDESRRAYRPVAFYPWRGSDNDFVFNDQERQNWVSASRWTTVMYKFPELSQRFDKVVISNPSDRTRLSVGLIYEVPKSQTTLSFVEQAR